MVVGQKPVSLHTWGISVSSYLFVANLLRQSGSLTVKPRIPQGCLEKVHEGVPVDGNNPTTSSKQESAMSLRP